MICRSNEGGHSQANSPLTLLFLPHNTLLTLPLDVGMSKDNGKRKADVSTQQLADKLGGS